MVRVSVRGETESTAGALTTLKVTGTFTVFPTPEEMAIVAEYVPGARLGFTEASNEAGVVLPPVTVSQDSPLFITGTAVIEAPVGLVKTEIPWEPGVAEPW